MRGEYLNHNNEALAISIASEIKRHEEKIKLLEQQIRDRRAIIEKLRA